MSISDVIGEGSYGCVHKPSLKCKNKPKLSYKNKVSKVLLKSAAKEELEEYKNLKNADKKNEFYVGKPVSCEIEDIPANIDSIKKCTIGSDVLNDLKHHKINNTNIPQRFPNVLQPTSVLRKQGRQAKFSILSLLGFG